MHWPARVASWWARWRRPKPLGSLGERAAEKLLRRKGYKIVARGARLHIGELDLVAIDGDTIVFVEVKTRRSERFGRAFEAVDQRKQRRLTRLAIAFLKRHRLLEHRCRFDVVSVLWPADQRRPTMDHYMNAFEATGFDGMFS